MKRPYITVNVAMTADGKIDSTARRGAAISSEADKTRVDRLRASVDAVLVGGRTLLNEDPKLTVKSRELRAERLSKGWPENPAKVGVVTDVGAAIMVAPREMGKILPLQNFIKFGPAKVFLFTTQCVEPEVIALFENAGATVHTMGENQVDLVAVFQSLHETGIRSVLVEGGGTLIAELFRLDLVDEMYIYVAPKILGGASSPTLADGQGFLPENAPALKLELVKKYDDDGGIFIHYTIEHKE